MKTTKKHEPTFDVYLTHFKINKFPHFVEFKRKMGQDVEYSAPDGTHTNPEDLSAELLKKLASEIILKLPQ